MVPLSGSCLEDTPSVELDWVGAALQAKALLSGRPAFDAWPFACDRANNGARIDPNTSLGGIWVAPAELGGRIRETDLWPTQTLTDIEGSGNFLDDGADTGVIFTNPHPCYPAHIFCVIRCENVYAVVPPPCTCEVLLQISVNGTTWANEASLNFDTPFGATFGLTLGVPLGDFFTRSVNPGGSLDMRGRLRVNVSNGTVLEVTRGPIELDALWVAAAAP